MNTNESINTFAERYAKIRGEKAGTKLLLPMMIQLLVVLMIVVVPAFVSMQI